MTATIPS